MRIRLAPILMLGTVATVLFTWVVTSQAVIGFGQDNAGGFSATPTVANTTKSDPSDVIFWCIVLLGAAFVTGLAFWILRKKLMAGDDAPDVGGMNLGFTLADLRQMHAEGQMTDEEFEYAKRKMAARAKAEIEGVDQDDPNSDQAAGPPIEDLGDITGTAPENPGSEPSEGSSTDVPETDPDNDGGIEGDSGADPDKID